MGKRETKLIKNSLVLLMGTVLTKGINFIMAPLFTRWMSLEDYGTFDMFSTYSVLLIPIIALGIHHAIFRFILEDESEENVISVFSNAMFINIVGILIYIVGITFVVIYKPVFLHSACMLTILFICQTLQNMMGMYLRGLKQLRYYTISNVICTVGILVFVFLFVYVLNLGLDGMIIGYSVSYLLSALCGVMLTKSYNIFKFNVINKTKMKELLMYAIPMIPNSIAWWILNISNRIIVSSILGVATNAVLAVANKLPNICVSIYDVFQTAWMESASEGIKDKDWDAFFCRTFNTMGSLCVSISMLIITSNFVVYDLLFTNDYISGKELVPLLAISIIFSTLSQCLGSVFVAEFDSKIQAKTMIEAGVINIIVHFVLIYSVGLYASAISTLISYLYLFVRRYSKIRKKYDIYIANKVKILFVICILFLFITYIENKSIDVFVFCISLIIALFVNKDVLLLLYNKIRRRQS